MKIAAVICELNPFHNGHARLFSELRRQYGADYIIALMSGNYVQRGEPAVFDKYARARMALGPASGSAFSVPASSGSGGYCDLVLQIPTIFATASAREFAAAGVAMAHACGCVDFLGFGMEAPATPDSLRLNAQKLAAGSIYSCPEEGSSDPSIRKMLDAGMTYPAALAKHLGLTDYTPNNILATEYLRAMLDAGSTITAAPVYRQGESYHSTGLPDAGLSDESPNCAVPSDGVLPGPSCASATAIRALLERWRNGDADDVLSALSPYVPGWTLSVYKQALPYYMDADRFSLLLSERLLSAVNSKDLSVYADVSEEIANRLLQRGAYPMNFTGRTADTKTRQYTYTRISRALLHTALGITKEETGKKKESGYISALRILGFRKDASALLSVLKSSALVPLISKTADRRPLLSRELYFDQLYYAALAGPAQGNQSPAERLKNEFERSPVTV